MKIINLKIGGMTCKHCADSLERLIYSLKGVYEVSVSFGQKNARIVFDDKKYPKKQLAKPFAKQALTML